METLVPFFSNKSCFLCDVCHAIRNCEYKQYMQNENVKLKINLQWLCRTVLTSDPCIPSSYPMTDTIVCR